MQKYVGGNEHVQFSNDSMDHRYKICSTQNVKYNQPSGAVPSWRENYDRL